MPTSPDATLQDHYAILEVDPQSVSETIQWAYSKLAQRYHSRNTDTGDAGMFEALNLAYEVLSDPARRKEFDNQQGISQEGGSPKFSGVEFFDALGPEAGLRTAILCLLYDRRRTRPSAPGLSMRQVEIMVEATAVELSAALWYMKQRALVSTDDKSNMQITVDGMDFLVSARPVPEDVMAFIKPAAVVVTQLQPQTHTDTRSAFGHRDQPGLSTLKRALARAQDQPKLASSITGKE
jgi:DnaJ domain